MEPILKDIEESYDYITLEKINIETDADHLVEPYGIMSIPTLLIFKNGELKDRIIGAVTKMKIMETINKYN